MEFDRSIEYSNLVSASIKRNEKWTDC